LNDESSRQDVREQAILHGLTTSHTLKPNLVSSSMQMPFERTFTQLSKQISTGLLNEVFDCIDLANHVGVVGRQFRDRSSEWNRIQTTSEMLR
jgi:hypothetical protein